MRRAGELLRAGAAGPIVAVIATEGMKADGVSLRMAGANLSRYKRNPVILVSHDNRSIPIGRADRVRVEGARLLADLSFDLDDPTGAAVDRKLRAGVLNAFSVGFEVDRWGANGVAEAWTLNEVSVVAVPLDADALVLGRSHRGGLDQRGAAKVLDALTLPDPVEARVRRVAREVLADYIAGRL